MLWEVDIHAKVGERDRLAESVADGAPALGLAPDLAVTSARGYLLESDTLERSQVERLARELLADSVVERTVVAPVGDPLLIQGPTKQPRLVHVLPKPGVMDPVAQSALDAIADFSINVQAIRTFRKYWISDISDNDLQTICGKLLSNEAIEQVILGPFTFDRLELGDRYEFQRVTVRIDSLDDKQLQQLSREGQLYLQLAEMQTIQAYFRDLGRDPSDIELETIAQTWSEHCSHKTLAGRIEYRDENGVRHFENMLKETIFAATQEIRQRAGENDWCVSVFEDNAGIVRFDQEYNVAFKVETHNHPSALEPYGGANTGIGGVIRDIMGTGLGARPIASTDVFCFAPPDIDHQDLPPGVLHPRRVMQGVVAGVRDYGNRMGIPTVNGAIYFDRRYLGNPLVYCGSVGLIPHGKSHKCPQPDDWIVAVGGRTGRDGIHGATFSSAELTSHSESMSGGAVQIGNAITEKMVLDVLLAARDLGLYTAITDCGAGGFSSAVGEMGEKIGAEVWLDHAPLKYEGLSYTEVWISEAQERMVVSVPPEHWDDLHALCVSEGVEATIIGKFVPTDRLLLKYNDSVVGDLAMDFLHNGRPPVIRQAEYQSAPATAQPLPEKFTWNYTPELLEILGSLNVASKEWVIRQYDHEVQGGSTIKPLVGPENDGPGDAAVIRPILGSQRGISISCGMNPLYGDLDTYHMAASAMDEAVRNSVAVGANPDRIAVLDNFCWGDCEKSETLGSLVRAALACHDLALAWNTPFVSGKDSLNNEFSYQDAGGNRKTIAIPASLLISALGQIEDVSRTTTMDLKRAGSFLYQVGATKDELGGSHFALVQSLTGGQVPQVDTTVAQQTFRAVHRAIVDGVVCACHDLCEGGLAAAAAEMAFAGGRGARIFLGQVPHTIELSTEDRVAAEKLLAMLPDSDSVRGDFNSLAAVPEATAILLFSESNSRFLCEVPEEATERFEERMTGVPHSLIGEVTVEKMLQIVGIPAPNPDHEEGHPDPMTAPLVVSADLATLKEAWKAPLRWS